MSKEHDLFLALPIYTIFFYIIPRPPTNCIIICKFFLSFSIFWERYKGKKWHLFLVFCSTVIFFCSFNEVQRNTFWIRSFILYFILQRKIRRSHLWPHSCLNCYHYFNSGSCIGVELWPWFWFFQFPFEWKIWSRKKLFNCIKK